MRLNRCSNSDRNTRQPQRRRRHAHTHRRSRWGYTSRVLATRSRWGYTVGSRAPDAAIASGTTKGEQEKWNLANLFKKAAPPPPKAKGSRMKRPGTI